jgi:outer membrane protein
MYIIAKFVFIFFLILSNISTLYSAENIAYINLDFILENSKIGKLIYKDLNQINKKNLEELKILESTLKNKENEIKKKKNIISTTEFNKEINLLKNDIQKFQIKKNEMVDVFNKRKNTQLSEFLDKINPIIQKYMSENAINILLDKKNVYIGSINFDITNDIINLIDKNLN